MAESTRTTLYFDGMAWPNPDDHEDSLWRCVHGGYDKTDVRFAVRMAQAYMQLVGDTQKIRNGKVANIRIERDKVRANQNPSNEEQS